MFAGQKYERPRRALHISTSLDLCSGSQNEVQRFRRDDVKILVLDDHEDPKEVSSDGGQRILAHGRLLVFVNHAMQPLNVAQHLCVLLGIPLMNAQETERFLKFIFEQKLVLRLRLTEHLTP